MAFLAELNSATSTAWTTEGPFSAFFSWKIDVVLDTDFRKCLSKTWIWSKEALHTISFHGIVAIGLLTSSQHSKQPTATKYDPTSTLPQPQPLTHQETSSDLALMQL